MQGGGAKERRKRKSEGRKWDCEIEAQREEENILSQNRIYELHSFFVHQTKEITENVQ